MILKEGLKAYGRQMIEASRKNRKMYAVVHFMLCYKTRLYCVREKLGCGKNGRGEGVAAKNCCATTGSERWLILDVPRRPSEVASSLLNIKIQVSLKYP